MMEIDEQVVLNQVNKQRLSKNEQKSSVPVTNRSTTEILPPDYSISEPSGQMQEVTGIKGEFYGSNFLVLVLTNEEEILICQVLPVLLCTSDYD